MAQVAVKGNPTGAKKKTTPRRTNKKKVSYGQAAGKTAITVGVAGLVVGVISVAGGAIAKAQSAAPAKLDESGAVVKPARAAKSTGVRVGTQAGVAVASAGLSALTARAAPPVAIGFGLASALMLGYMVFGRAGVIRDMLSAGENARVASKKTTQSQLQAAKSRPLSGTSETVGQMAAPKPQARAPRRQSRGMAGTRKTVGQMVSARAE